MSKIGIIGDRDTVLGFKAIGVEIFETSDFRDAHKIILRLAKTDYAVIFITERLAKDLGETLGEFKDQLVPAIILIPDHLGSMHLAMEGINQNIVKAIGSQIVLEKEGQRNE